MTLPSWTRRPRRVAVAAFRRSGRWGRQWIQPILEHVRTRFWLYVRLALIGAAVVGVWSLINFWDWLQTERIGEAVGKESGSTTVRNLGLVIGGVAAILLAVWRSRVAERQAGAAQSQSDTAQQSLLHERSQRGAEMLGNDVLAVRLGGIYALQRLAEEHPVQYHVQVMQLLCAFARHPTRDEGVETKPDREEEPQLRQDVQAVMTAISACHARQLEPEDRAGFDLDLRGAHLANAELWRAALSDAILDGANLSGAELADADLSDAWLQRTDLSNTALQRANLSLALLDNANLSDAKLPGANLSGTTLFDTNLSSARFSARTRGLTQDQLDQARADPDNPPHLDGVVDAETGQPLVWRGKPLEEDAEPGAAEALK